MNVSFGLFPALDGGNARAPRRERHVRLAARAREELAPWLSSVGA